MPDPSKRRAIGGWLHRRAENLAAAMLAVMFLAFIIQILFRYVLNLPVGWTSEVSSILWIWLVLFGAAFVLSEREEIRFDLLHTAAGPRVRGGMAALAALGLIVLYAGSLPAVVDYVAFMKVESTSYLKLRLDWVYSIYVLFAVAIVLRYLRLLWLALRGHSSRDAADDAAPGSGL